MVNDINSIISDLTKIDKASSQIMESTRKEKEAYASMIKQKTKEFDEQLSSSIDKQVNQLNLLKMSTLLMTSRRKQKPH